MNEARMDPEQPSGRDGEGVRPAKQADPAGGPLGWRAVVAEAEKSTSALTRRPDPRLPSLEDLRQEALLRLLEARVKGARIDSCPAWMHGTIGHVIAAMGPPKDPFPLVYKHKCDDKNQ